MFVRDNPVCPWCKIDNTVIIPPTRRVRWCFDCRTTFDPRQVHIPAPQ